MEKLPTKSIKMQARVKPADALMFDRYANRYSMSRSEFLRIAITQKIESCKRFDPLLFPKLKISSEESDKPSAELYKLIDKELAKRIEANSDQFYEEVKHELDISLDFDPLEITVYKGQIQTVIAINEDGDKRDITNIFLT
jgi:hypothetical protein